MRLDQLLVERALAKSRAAAQRAIAAGEVLVDGQLKDKPATEISLSSKIELKSKPKYVSQGGLKLEKALKVFNISAANKIGLDIGASTGGFTDCLIKNGAKKIFAVDVGKGQLDWSLRNDSRVVVMEEVNARYLEPEQIGEHVDLVVIDVSFISLRLILPQLKLIIKESGEIITLIKPQFEAGRKNVQQGGVVKDPSVHQDVLESLAEFIVTKLRYSICGATHSPIKGPAGNIEFLTYLKPISDQSHKIDWQHVVNDAHQELD
ncbi:TlyA family RNA methyltransferase [Candidatus Acetothermia bacterium]|nr:TlyA family RNA methyltransferase [Candidatus Acetothermia bacterium]MBI3643353.1 TlyA family RNA methyltransferase [Candidatus Acetothermia bacterium]